MQIGNGPVHGILTTKKNQGKKMKIVQDKVSYNDTGNSQTAQLPAGFLGV